MKDKSLHEIKKGALIRFKLPERYNTEQAHKILNNFYDLFGKFGILISDIYMIDDNKWVADIWFPSGNVFDAVPLDKFVCL